MLYAMPYPTKKNFRAAFIKNALDFAEAVARLPGVLRIALIGSITTSKPKPKDVDLLVTISEDISIQSLATLGRKLSGKEMSVGDSSGADVFLANEDHEYLGRTCSYRECHPRVRCRGTQCNGSYINNDLYVVRLKKKLILSPPVEVYPAVLIRKPLPDDLQAALESYQKLHFSGQGIRKEY
jgi:predicted nucleotidyltransferase